MIAVFGSSNTDFVIAASKFPLKGETVTGGRFAVFPGGKGANQAAAIARLGGRVQLVSKIGADYYGDKRIEHLKRSGVDTSRVIRDKRHRSGIAFIVVDKSGANRIVVAPGSNEHLSPADIAGSSKVIEGAKVVLLQLEMPVETAAKVVEVAARLGKNVILNPAPFKRLPLRVLSRACILTPNEVEVKRLLGIKVDDLASARRARPKALRLGIENLLVTIGKKGVIIINRDGVRLVPAIKLRPVDTTGAGDAFNGALAFALSKGVHIYRAARFANTAAAVSTMRPGAASSLPTLKQVREYARSL